MDSATYHHNNSLDFTDIVKRQWTHLIASLRTHPHCWDLQPCFSHWLTACCFLGQDSVDHEVQTRIFFFQQSQLGNLRCSNTQHTYKMIILTNWSCWCECILRLTQNALECSNGSLKENISYAFKSIILLRDSTLHPNLLRVKCTFKCPQRFHPSP